jgi:hypothetical protein
MDATASTYRAGEGAQRRSAMSQFEPLIKVAIPAPTEAKARALMEYEPQLTIERAFQLLNSEYKCAEAWQNSQYDVRVRRHSKHTHLNIRNRDGKAIFRDWRHFQEIKNQLVGNENEAIELYPAESRLVDYANSYHLFVHNDPAFRFPFGWMDRNVSDGLDEGTCPPGLAQRPLRDGYSARSTMPPPTDGTRENGNPFAKPGMSH